MLKIQLGLLIGNTLGNKEIWYCHDENTNKFYKMTIEVNGSDAIETIEEVLEEQVKNYMYQNKDEILKAMNIQ